MHRILFQIGPVVIYTYGVFIALAVLVCVLLIKRDCARSDTPFEKLLDCLVITLIGGIAGSRLLYVLVNWTYYAEYPWQVFALRDGGMAFQGGLVLGTLSGIIACRIKKIGFLKTGDLIAPYLALGHCIGRIGCFFNGCCYGKVIEQGVGVTFPGEDFMRIPTQLYSSFFLLIIFVMLLRIRRKDLFDGAALCAYMILYGLFRFMIGFARADNPDLLMGLKLSQILSVFLLVCGMVLWKILSNKNKV